MEEVETIKNSFSISLKDNWKKYTATIAATIALLAGIAEFSGYSVRDLFQKKEVRIQPVSPQAPSKKASTIFFYKPHKMTIIN